MQVKTNISEFESAEKKNYLYIYFQIHDIFFFSGKPRYELLLTEFKLTSKYR